MSKLLNMIKYCYLYLCALLRGLHSSPSRLCAYMDNGYNVVFDEMDLKTGFSYYNCGAVPYIIFSGSQSKQAIFVDRDCPSLKLEA